MVGLNVCVTVLPHKMDMYKNIAPDNINYPVRIIACDARKAKSGVSRIWMSNLNVCTWYPCGRGID